jgi:putative ABC transport system ATP-binding protein
MSVLNAVELYRFFHIGDDETAALRGVSLSLDAGETVALVGPSGSGKSTLIGCLTGLDEPDGGWVSVNEQRLTRRSEKVRARLRALNFGIMLQSANLFQHLTVEENIGFQMQVAGRIDTERVSLLLEAVGISHRAKSYPASLSGGETARAGLATVIAADPPILIADEPTAEVDAETEQLLFELFDQRKRAGQVTLLSTHSTALADRADRIIHLRDGRIGDA